MSASFSSPVRLRLLLALCLLLSMTCTTSMDPSKDYYKTLGVSETFSDRELKKSYRQLALKYHPDKAENAQQKEAAKKQFVEVSEAYEVLSDPAKRQEYDEARTFGASGFPQGQQGSQRSSDETMASFTKMFENIFGHGFQDSTQRFTTRSSGFSGASGGFSGFPGASPGREHPNEFQFSGMDGFGQSQQPGGGVRYPRRPTTLFASDSPVKSLSKRKFPDKDATHEWLVQFYTIDAPSAEFRNQYQKIARDLKGKVRVGAVNCDKYPKFCASHGITTFPTCVYVWEGKLSKYTGEMDEYQVYNFAIEKHIARLQKMRQAGEIEKLYAGNAAKLCNVGKHATSTGSSLCAVFVLSSDKKEREREMKIAKDVAAKFRHSKGLHIAYVDWKTQQHAVRKLIESVVGHSHRKQDPTLLVIRTKRGKTRVGVHVLDAAFTTDALSATMERAVGGDLAMGPVHGPLHFA